MRHLPAGTVTLLFSDIEGSSQILQRLGDRYASVLEESRCLLREAFQRWHGHEVDMQGDSFFVAFARATDAVSAAVDAQLALAAHAWPQGGTVRVRMGLHTGEPSLTSAGYVGIDVHQAARIMSAAHGGQVLISRATHDLVAHRLPGSVSIRDMGEHHLKDLQRPMHLYQLVIAGLPADFPSLKTLNVYPNNLPVQPTPLIGRENEMAAIEQLLRHEETRLVTLTGPGGTGKTRLALQAAADLSDLFSDGSYFVDLAPVSDPALVIPTIAQTLGLRDRENLAPMQHLKDELRQKQMLLLLDNFEQVIHAAVQVADLLASCPRLKLLVTSRAVLHLRAEREFAVPPLSLPGARERLDLSTLSRYEAIALFVQRTQAVKPAFRLTKENAPLVMEIAARLDGLPLAIELAAARMKLLSPEALLARLSQRLQILTGGTRDVAARQQTLRNTIEWSYNLLDAREQQLFRRISVFSGGCTLEAVETVCATRDDEASSILDSLASLIDKSLVQRKEQGPDPRFTMLETIREYALEALAATGERESARKTHAAYFLALVQQMEPELWALSDQGAFRRVVPALSQQMEPELWALSDPTLYLDQLEQEHDNFRAAMQWSLEQEDREMALRLGASLRPFWYMCGHFSEGLDFLEQALVKSEGVEASVRARALFTAARMNDLTGNIDRAASLIAESLALYDALGDSTDIAYALHLQADIAWRKGDFSMARTGAEESLALFRKTNNIGEIAGLLVHLGVLAADQGRYTEAFDLLEEGLSVSRESGDTANIAESLVNLARVCYFTGDNLVQARAYFEEGFALHRSTGDRESIGYCLHLSGLLALEEGHIDQARSLVEQAVALLRELKQWHGTALSTAALARVMAVQGDEAQARTLYEESIALAMKAGDRLIIAAGLEGLADVAARQGKGARAARLWGAAEALREALDAPIHPVERPGYEKGVAATRAQLDEQAFATAWMEGRTTPLEQIISITAHRD